MSKIPGFRSGKTWKKVVATIGYLFIFLMIYGFIKNSGDSSTAPTTASSNTQSSKTAETQKPTEQAQPEFDFTKADLTKENVIKAISKAIPEKQITEVTIEQKDGGNIVDIHYNPGTEWSEKTLVQNSANRAVDIFEILLAHPQVTKAWVWTQNEMTDAKGNNSLQDVVNIALSKNNAKDINWKNFKPMVSNDYNKLFNIADSKYIHPAIQKALNK